MPLAFIDRSACVGWCPVGHQALLAAGTQSGAIDMSFSTSSVLEVFALDFASGGASPAVRGSVAVPERFSRLAWGVKPSEQANLPYGIIAGGLSDGTICIWNPAPLVEGSGQNPLLSKLQKHSGAVKGLEFNSFSPNLLASGAADGELCIWDVANPAQPSLYPALKGPAAAGAGPAPEITCVAWNKKVQHILASTQVDGATVVWDLKKQRPVITLKDPNSQRRCSVLQWNPDVATQLVVASEDDRTPTLQMWDLRNSMSPVKEFVGHVKGVMGMSWCPQDHSLLLSCSKDHRTICWDVSSTDIVCEMPTQDSWSFDVQWSPTIPGVYSSSVYDGKVAISNVLDCTSAGVDSVNADFSVTHTPGDARPLKRPPNWLKRPVSVSFGFGGRLASLTNHKQQMQDPMTGQVRPVDTGAVALSQVVTEQQLVEHSEAFENAIVGRDRAALQDFCSRKAAVAAAGGSTEESETWTFMGVLFEEDARRQLLAKLGFSDAMLPQTTSATAATGADQSAGSALGHENSVGVGLAEQQLNTAMQQLGMSEGGKPSIELPSGEDFFNQQEHDNPEGFFDSLPDHPTPPADYTPSGMSAGGLDPNRRASSLGGAAANGITGEPSTPMGIDPNHIPEGAEREEEIQKAIFVGNYDGAVDTCLKAGRLADALLIANIGGAELFKKTMQRYMRRNPRPYMAVISAMVDSDYMSLVKTRPVGQWRETLAVLATYTGAEEWASLCDALASRLAQTGMAHAASLCYICAGNVDQAVSYWSKAVRASGNSVVQLQAVIEKSVVLGLATNTASTSNSLAELMTTYASTLATQGRLGAALRYLEMVPGEASTSVAVLKDRIYRSGTSTLPENVPAPPFPFQSEDIRPSGQPSTPEPMASSMGYSKHAYGSAAAVGQAGGYGGGYSAPAAASQQGGYGAYGAAAAPAAAAGAYGAAGAAAGRAYTSPTPAAAYGQQGSQGAYGAAAGGGYGQQSQPQQAPSSFVPATAAPAAGGGGYGSAAGGYGSSSSTGYSQQGAAAGYGSYQQQQPQSSQQVYQPKRAASSTQAPGMPQPSFTPSVPAAASTTGVPGAFTPAMPASGGSHQMQQTVQPRTQFTPTASTTVAQPPPAAAASSGYGAPPPMAGAAAGPGMMGGGMGMQGGSMAPGGLMGAGGSGQMGMMQGPGSMGAPPAAAPPAQPAGPPAHITMATADVSKVPADQKAVLASLSNLFNFCMQAASTPAKKREMDDNSRRIGTLFWKLNEGQVAPHVLQKLLQLCGALDAGNWPAAAHIQVELTASDWDECGMWLTALKRLIKIRQAMG